MSSKYLNSVLSIGLLIYAFHWIYILKVNHEDFAINQRLKINAETTEFFKFLTQEHVLEQLLPWLTRFKEADSRMLTVGKFYRAFLKLPILGIGRINLRVVEYKPWKLLVLESSDSITKQRVEIRATCYHDRTILHTTVYLRRDSALYHYTVGVALRWYIVGHLKKSSLRVAEIYKTFEERRRISDMY